MKWIRMTESDWSAVLRSQEAILRRWEGGWLLLVRTIRGDELHEITARTSAEAMRKAAAILEGTR